MKRKRGGQSGNQNARKHGFYRGALAPEEMGEFWRFVDTRNLEPEIAFLFLKLRSALQNDPDNCRVRKDAVRLLAGWYSAKLGFTRADSLFLKKAILELFENIPVIRDEEPKPNNLQNESSVL